MANSPGALIDRREIRHFHLFCGLGGGARGFNRGTARVGNMVGNFRCIGGIDVDPASIRDFGRLAGVPGTVLDLFDREQFEAFHGHAPPSGWREATPADIHAAAGHERPHIVFLSAPCKGFSGLLSEGKSQSPKYQALNKLTLRGIFLMLEAYRDDPPELVIFENVPRIANRGRKLLDRITGLLRAYGYVVAETTHDCGKLGGLAQSRKRFLLVARHAAKVPPFLYEPPKRSLRAVGDILGRMPMPGDLTAGPMHRVPSLRWQTWVRLAFVEAGSDWRSLSKLAVDDGMLRDYALIPDEEWRAGVLGVRRWEDHSVTVAGRSSPSNNAYSVADPRWVSSAKWRDGQQYGVNDWSDPGHCVTGSRAPGQGVCAVADPRHGGEPKFNNCYRIVRWNETSAAVTGGTGPSAGGLSVADPRAHGGHEGGGKYRVSGWEGTGGTVIAASGTGNGAFAVADPRPDNARQFDNIFRVTDWESPSRTVIGRTQPSDGAMSVADPRPGYGESTHSNVLRVTDWDAQSGTVTGAHHPSGGAMCVADPRCEERRGGALGVTPWQENAGTVAGESLPSNGAFSVADPRPGLQRGKGDDYVTAGHFGVIRWDGPTGAVSSAACQDNGRWSVADPRLPDPTDRVVAVIRALDGTWHRPFTTFELAGLQSLVEPEEQLELDGLSDADWRERIGNAVPPDAAQAIASTMGTTLLLAWSGEGFMLSSVPIWVRPVAVALAVKPQDWEEGL